MTYQYGPKQIGILLGEVDRVRGTSAVKTTSITNFSLTQNSVTKGVDVNFSLANVSGIDSITLKRNSSADPATAIVLQTWSASEAKFTWSDTDAKLQAMPEAYYWLDIKPANITDAIVQDGPEVIVLNPTLQPPAPATGISASHGIAKNGILTVTVNVSVVTTGTYSVKIYVSGYEGVAGFVALAQQASSPFQFKMNATGETVTFKAIAVSSGGGEATSGPTCTLTLNGALTVPAAPLQVMVTQIATGNQIVAIASKDEGVTSYQLWRNQSGGGFGTASNIATLAVGVGLVQYLDTSGLTNLWEYYLVAVNSAGSSLPSPAATAFVVYSSAQVPPNVPLNTTNTATVDSTDAGSNATIRIYGPGGVGTGYTRITGYGSPTRPAGTITGQPYTTALYVIYTGGAYLAVTTFGATLPDGWEFVAKVTTVAAGGGGGTGGGGGSGGGSPCFSGDVEVQTVDGFVSFYRLPEKFRIVNSTGEFEAELVKHEFSGSMIEFAAGKYVTFGHAFRVGDEWKPAAEVFAGKPTWKFKGTVFNLHVQSSEGKDHHYCLRDGLIAHNFIKA